MATETWNGTCREIQNGWAAAEVAEKPKAPVDMKLKLMDFKAVLRGELTKIEDLIKAKRLEHAVKKTITTKDDDGNDVQKDVPVPLTINGTEIPHQWTYDDALALDADLNAILDQPRELNIVLFTRDDIKSLKEFEGGIEGLYPFVKK